MKKILFLLLFISPFAFGQTMVCPSYTGVGDAWSPYILTSDPDCAICLPGADGPWSGASCTGTITITADAPTLSLDIAFTAVNLDDYATITIDGGGVMTLTGENVGVTGDEIGPYTCGGSYGDVFVTVESTMPFTTVTLTNTGCSSGWVLACPGGDAAAGDDSTVVVCTGIVTLSDLLSDDAESGGTWTETTGSGFFDPGTTEFDAGMAGVGTYTFEYEVEGCDGTLDLAVFTVNVGPGGSAGEDNTAELCNSIGETLDLNTLLIGADPGGDWAETSASGAFDPITGVFDATGLPGGVYTFTYTFPVDPPCEDDVADFEVTVNAAPIVSIVTDPDPAIICLGETMTLTASGAGVGGTYVWDHPMTNGVAFTPPAGIDTYNVVATDTEGCEGTGAVDIEVQLVPNVSFLADTLSGCDPLPVEFTNTTDLPGISCLWEFGDGSSSTDCGTVEHVYNTPGEFDVTLTVASSEYCSATATYTNYILILDPPQADFTFLPNPIDIENTQVQFENNSRYASFYEWQFGDGTPLNYDFEPEHVFPTDANETYNIRLVASNEVGCADTIFKPITVNDVITFYIPNTFTPDGDLFNEQFMPVMTSGYDPYDYQLIIYNRWGEVLFESFNAAVGWDGTYANGKIVPDGVYIWHIQFGDTISDEKHEYQGHVTVLK